MRVAFKMKFYEGKHYEYEKRHSNVYPELESLLKESGAKNYSIFLDEKTNILFGYVELESLEKWDKIPESKICQKWWAYMKDIMETNLDNSPISIRLKEVYHLD
ncbi:L-rhamnose mutarotase [Cetobacterium sp.]|uniref:L-rhamnose mutarotase n=1 Tax=Cetobacterium sp. TaxID=2071632 RepID=UPI003F308B75